MDTRLLSVSEAYRLLGIGRTSFYGLLGKGKIAAVKIGTRTLIPSDSIDAFIASLSEAK